MIAGICLTVAPSGARTQREGQVALCAGSKRQPVAQYVGGEQASSVFGGLSGAVT